MTSAATVSGWLSAGWFPRLAGGASKHSDHTGCRLPQPPLLSEAVSQLSHISDPGQLLRQDDRGSRGKETEDQRLWPLQSTDKYGGGRGKSTFTAASHCLDVSSKNELSCSLVSNLVGILCTSRTKVQLDSSLTIPHTALELPPSQHKKPCFNIVQI